MILSLTSCVHDPLVSPEKDLSVDPGENYVEIECDEDSVYFENDILPIIITYCGESKACHKQKTEGKIVTNVYHNYLKQKFVPFDPMASKLYTSLISDDPDELTAIK